MKKAVGFSKLLAFTILPLAFLFGGCEAFFPGNGSEPCIDNLDCSLGEVCDLEKGRCVPVDTPKPLSVVDLELTPSVDSDAAATQVPTVDLSQLDPEQMPLQVAAAVQLGGMVPSPDAMGGIPGTLVATRQPGFDNRSLIFNIPVGDSGEYESRLTAGTYDLLFKPTNRDNFPQLLLSGLELPADEEPYLGYHGFANPEKDDLTDQDPLLVVRGRVLQSQVYANPVTGMKIEGITDQGLRTSVAVPDQQGIFYLRLPFSRSVVTDGQYDDAFPQTMDVTIRPCSSDVMQPTVTVEGVELDDHELGTFYVGEVSDLRSVSGVVLDSRGRPVANCTLRFESNEIGNGVLTHQTRSDSSGEYEASLPEGNYVVTAVPELLSEARMHSTELELAEDKVSNIQLPDKLILTGTLVDHEGNPAADVVVRAKRLSAVSGEEDGVIRTYETITSAGGVFNLFVDHGRYSVSFIPSPASGLARSLPKVAYILDDYQMESSAIRLPEPSLIKGNVYDAKGTPMCGVNIEVFYSPDENNSHLIGQTISGGNLEECTGAYSMIIPGQNLQ